MENFRQDSTFWMALHLWELSSYIIDGAETAGST